MPHFTIEHSPADRLGLSDIDLVRAVFAAAEGSGLFGTEDIKVRALPCATHQNGASNYAFIHVGIRIMPGRSDAQKRELAESVADALKALGPSAGSITAEVHEINRAFYAKHVNPA